jgi:hypothetical protein
MRMMLRITIPTEDGNRAIKDGSLPKLLEATVRNLKSSIPCFAVT